MTDAGRGYPDLHEHLEASRDTASPLDHRRAELGEPLTFRVKALACGDERPKLASAERPFFGCGGSHGEDRGENEK